MHLSRVALVPVIVGILVGAFGLAGPSMARDLRLGKHSADELKAVCEKVGGRFSQGEKRYGCGTDCHGAPGTDCIVSCDADQKCSAQVIGARRPRTIESALKR